METKNLNQNQKENVFTKEVKPLSWHTYFFQSFLNILGSLCKKLLDLLVSIFVSLFSFLVAISAGLVKACYSVYKFFKRKVHQFIYNDKYGRLSYVAFGIGSIKHGQIVNGILYLIFEVAYIVLFILFGAPAISKITTLGTKTVIEVCDEFGYCEQKRGDNSIMILIYALLWILSIFLFIYIWNRSINAEYKNHRIEKYVEYEEIYSHHKDFAADLDEEIKKEYYETGKVKKSNVKSKINDYCLSIGDKKESKYARYLLLNVLDDALVFLKKEAKLVKKIKSLTSKKESYVANQNDRLAHLESQTFDDDALKEKHSVKIDKFKNKIMLKTVAFDAKIKKQEHLLFEVRKTYSNHVEKQITRNNDTYGKFNFYYRHVADLDKQLNFFKNYFALVDIYHNSLGGSDAQNKANKEALIRLRKELEDKNAATEEKYALLFKKKANLEAELKELKTNYHNNVKEIHEKHPDNMDELLVEAKTELVAETTRVMRLLSDLPADKYIKAMRKEELKESKHAYIRDKKYLRTNFTSETFALEKVVETMMLQYEFEYKEAHEFVNAYFKNKKGNFLSEDEINSKIDALTIEKESYIAAKSNKFDGKPKTFMEQIKSLFNENFHITILLLPVIGIALFTIVPLLFSVLIAFTNYSKGHEPPQQLFTWIGFSNFVQLFNPDPTTQFAQLPKALGLTLSWTLIWAVAATFSNYFLGIIVALMINKDGIKLKKFWRTIFVLTIAIPQFISLLSIATLLKDTGAIGTWWLQTFGSKLGFATSKNVAGTKLIIILVNIWVGIPYTILSTTGILLNIPKDLYESSKVDGAGTVTQFFKITMPYILFVTGPYLITQFVGNINNFNVIFFLTGGDPTISGSILQVGETDLLITFLYELITSVSNPQYGIASAVGIIIFAVCSFFSIIMYNKSGAIQQEDQFQ